MDKQDADARVRQTTKQCMQARQDELETTYIKLKMKKFDEFSDTDKRNLLSIFVNNSTVLSKIYDLLFSAQDDNKMLLKKLHRSKKAERISAEN